MHPPNLRAAAAAAVTATLLVACAPTRPAAVRPAPAAPARIGAAAQPKADGPQVTIQDFAFAPNAIVVPVGATLTWTNRDSEPHTVMTTDKAIASKALDTDERFAFAFDAAGTYSY